MLIFFLILILISSLILSFIILVQNPKGGGLAGNIAGFSNQFMGVKQTTDVLEKGTWVFAVVIALLCITSTVFISGKSSGENKIEKVGTSIPQQQQQQPLSPSPATPNPNKK